jgi:hypothetical protein
MSVIVFGMKRENESIGVRSTKSVTGAEFNVFWQMIKVMRRIGKKPFPQARIRPNKLTTHPEKLRSQSASIQENTLCSRCRTLREDRFAM